MTSTKFQPIARSYSLTERRLKVAHEFGGMYRLETIKADDSAAERLLQRVFHFVARDVFEARRIVRAALARHDVDPQYFAALFHSDVPGQDVHFSLLTQHIMRVKADAQESAK